MTFGQDKDFCHNCGALLTYDSDTYEGQNPWSDPYGSRHCLNSSAGHTSESEYAESISVPDSFADQPREGK